MYALGTILGIGAVAPAFAQTDQFPDVPENHWAYDALAKLKAAGILVGYPDGLYRGGRPASRYELAVALHAAYQNLKNITDGLAAQIAAIKVPEGTDPAALQAIRDRLAALENQVNAMKGWGDEIANLKRMADTFQRELQSLGVDVEAMKRDLSDLSDRVTALENRKWVDISGDANFWVGMGNSRDGDYGLDMDGRINGTNFPANPFGKGSAVGMDRDISMLHELALTFAGTNKEGPKWHGTVVVGNMLSNKPATGFGNQSNGAQNIGFGYKDGDDDVYLQDFGIKFDTSVAGLGFNAEVGRVGYKISPYLFQRVDTTSYYDNDRWDNGMFYFDGGILGFNVGAAKLDVFGGKTAVRKSVNGVDINPVYTSVGVIDRTLGVNVNVPITTAGNLNLAYLWLGSDHPYTPAANNVQVFGGNLDFAFGGLKLEGGYSKSDTYLQGHKANTSDDTAWHVKAGWSSDKFGIWGAYREVEKFFTAPGDWGRLGIYKDLTNIKGFQVGGNINISNALTLEAGGEFDKPKDDSFFSDEGKITKYNVGLGFKANSALTFNLGYENTKFDPSWFGGVNSATFAWTTFGVGYGFSDKAKLKIQYQLSDVTNIGSTDFRGGFLTTQLSIKF